MLPQGAEDESSFWQVLENGRNLMTEWPESRTNIHAFYKQDPTVDNVVRYPNKTAPIMH